MRTVGETIRSENRADIRAVIEEMRLQIAEDNRANMRALSEENRAWFRAIDDKYQDLPERVRKLEEAVSSPPARTRRRK
ncbi:MAG: hypothetical protein ABJE66_08270 [Deltaproteobacteria bacterium]